MYNMNMLKFICLLFPSFVSLLIDFKLNEPRSNPVEHKKSRPDTTLFLRYPAYVVVNNIIVFLLILIKNRHSLPLTTDILTLDFFITYLVVATLVSIFTPIIGAYFFTDFTISYARILPKSYRPKKRRRFSERFKKLKRKINKVFKIKVTMDTKDSKRPSQNQNPQKPAAQPKTPAEKPKAQKPAEAKSSKTVTAKKPATKSKTASKPKTTEKPKSKEAKK